MPCSLDKNNNFISQCCMEINPKNNNNDNNTNIEKQNLKKAKTSNMISDYNNNTNININRVTNRLNYDFTPTDYPLMGLVRLKFK